MSNLTSHEIREKSKNYNLHSWSVQGSLNPIVVTKAEGIYYWDDTGKKYYDMSSQLVNLNIGYGNKKVIQAIKDQAEKLAYISPAYAIDVRSQLAEDLIAVAPDNMAKVFFALGGAEANENAIKIARMYTGRNKIFSRYRSYHGATYGAANLTGEPRRYPCEPGIPGFVKFFDPYLYRAGIKFESEEAAAKYYVDKLREQVEYEGPSDVAAIVMETVTGSNGIIIPPKGYMQGIRKICDDYGIVMVLDEVMTGFGRTGEWFACNHFNVKPDLISFAKGITCGYAPLGGVIASQKISAYFDDHLLNTGLTYSAHPIGCAAGIATLKVYKEDCIFENVKKIGSVLALKLETLKAKHRSVGDVRYIGLFSAIELIKDVKTHEALVPYGRDPEKIMPKIISMLKVKGFSTYSHENNIIIAPPLIITENELNEAMVIIDEVLDYVDTLVARG